MEHELKYDTENDIAVLTYKNDFLYKDVEPIFESVKEMFNDKPYRQIIVVMNSAYKVENRETREALSEKFSKLGVTEVAFIGLSAAVRMIARVELKTGAVKLKGEFFKDYKDAVIWLNKQKVILI